jgi:repressor LexA
MKTENTSGRIVLHDLDYAEKTSSNNLLLTVFGYVPCGSPNYIDDNIEGFLEIPKSMLGQGDFFVLRAKGDSMVDAGIKTGDLIIIKRQSTAEDGQIVVARLGNDVTLKKYYKLETENQIMLHPENEKYDDIVIRNCDIMGVAVKIIKDL